MTNKPALVAIFAHPDDEAFGTGGSLTKYVKQGVDVHVVVATRGEAGAIANPAVEATQPMSLLREEELRRACACYGVEHLHLLGYVDGQTAIVPPSEAVFKLVKLLRQIKPQVVVTFGPEGIYGHFDHLVVHRWSTAAVQLAADSHHWPEAGSAHQVAKLYYRATQQAQVDQMTERFGRDVILMDGIPFPFTGYPMEQITTVIDIRDYVEQKLSAIRCYASQFGPDTPILQNGFNPLSVPWFWQETFILAKHNGAEPAPTNNQKEGDLFTGVID